MRIYRSPAAWVFAILLSSYAFFWHGRDWNSASRLMLTYALVDRGTIAIDGMEDQTHDIARTRGHYYTDKTPGFSLLAVPPYWAAKAALRLPDHPLGAKGFAYWPADYWATLGTSGICSALAGVVLVWLALELGCGPRRAALIGLAYGLTTPAYAYATMAYGHQLAAFALLASFGLIWKGEKRPGATSALAGFLASYASVVEIQVGPVSAILGLYLLTMALAGRRPPRAVAWFAAGAAIPTAILLGYNFLAFGSPWKMGYFFLVTQRFAEVHSSANPLGLNRPDWSKLGELLWGERRGIVRYAPILALTPPGLIVMAAHRKLQGPAVVIGLTMVAVMLMNLSYPEWTGGWTTGPRLLVPLLPFAMLPVAALLGVGGRGVTALAIALALAGGALILMFQAVGGRIPDGIARPLVDRGLAALARRTTAPRLGLRQSLRPQSGDAGVPPIGPVAPDRTGLAPVPPARPVPGRRDRGDDPGPPGTSLRAVRDRAWLGDPERGGSVGVEHRCDRRPDAIPGSARPCIRASGSSSGSSAHTRCNS